MGARGILYRASFIPRLAACLPALRPPMARFMHLAVATVLPILSAVLSGCFPGAMLLTCPRPKDGEFPCDGRRIRQTCKDSHSLCDGGFVNTYLPCVSESACNAAIALVKPAVGYRPATCTKRVGSEAPGISTTA